MVGDDRIDCMVTDLARVRPRGVILGGSLIFPTGTAVLSELRTTVLCFSFVSAGFPLTEGQMFMPKGQTANQIPSYHEVLHFSPDYREVVKHGGRMAADHTCAVL